MVDSGFWVESIGGRQEEIRPPVWSERREDNRWTSGWKAPSTEGITYRMKWARLGLNNDVALDVDDGAIGWNWRHRRVKKRQIVFAAWIVVTDGVNVVVCLTLRNVLYVKSKKSKNAQNDWSKGRRWDGRHRKGKGNWKLSFAKSLDKD